MCTRNEYLALRRLLDDIAMPDHERASAAHTLARADAIASFIAAVARLPAAVSGSYRRNAGHAHPHPSHE